ncbi:efflux RND transporter permease subunit [Aliiroseovarius sp.]|uniref:efflux RND transporter permease subunit n=1 Tax=Aliiroseovarius sp. TaxID=1872442 RepID=UPI0026396CDD|nr:efflux RND transporter permease subunit [Aliiroseovarius sp.]
MFTPTGILSYFTRHATVANLLLIMMIAAGLVTYPNMRAQFFPDSVVESVTVNVVWEGAGAEDVDEAIVQVMEPSLLAVEGVESSASRSREGSARIFLEFETGWDMARAADDVQAAVDTISDLPEDAEDATVRRGAWRDTVTDVAITGPVGVDQLGRFADEFTVRLFNEGVTRTSITGVVAPETIVEVPSLSLMRHDVTMAQIAAAIAEEADADPAGNMASGAARVRTGVAKRTPDEIAAIVLRSNADGSNLTVGDVANVRVEGIDRARAYFVGDDPAIQVNVARSAQGDAVEIQEVVEEVAAEMLLSLPKGVGIEMFHTRSEVISSRLEMLTRNGLQGLGLVVLLLFLFLNARIAFWVAAGIPVAMLTAIALMYMAGLTINMISLFALIITLGIVVDDAIVVGEHADFRSRHLGEGPVEAAENAARRMFPPVFSSTLTTVIAFFGLMAIGGRFGNTIAAIPFTVIVVLIASLVECFLILPNHMAHALTHTAKQHWYDWPSRQVNKGFRLVRDRLFRRLMRVVIFARYPVLAGAILVLVSAAAFFIRGDLPFRFFNAPEQGVVSANFAMVEGATRDDTIEMMKLVQQVVEDIGGEFEAEYGVHPAAFVISGVGGGQGRGLSGVDTKDADLLGSISIEMVDADLRPYTSFDFVARLQDAVPRHPMLEVLSFRGVRHGPGGDALDIDLYGADAEVLKSAAEGLKELLAQFPEISAVEDTLAYDKEELVLELTPQGQALGFTIDALGRVIRNRLGGIEAATYPDGTRSAAIRVELPEGELSADFLEAAQMRTTAGEYVALGDIVTVTSRNGFSTVRRENGIRLVGVNGDIDEGDAARAEEITRALTSEILPEVAGRFGVEYRLGGLAEQEKEFLNEARTGLIMSLLGIYLVLAWIFSSWSRPLVVMSIIPFGLIGAIWGHLQWDVPLSLFSVIGLIGMTGIIINDSIVLVGTIDDYAKERGLFPAIIDGTADRLRPVLLTTLTTVLGLMPLLYEGSRQAEFLKPTVITLTYGLAFGMVLVLLVVPALLAMQSDLGRMTRALRRVPRARRARGLQAGLALVALGLVGVFAATLGPAVVSGTGMTAAFGQFALGSLAVVTGGGVILGLVMWLASRRGSHP